MGNYILLVGIPTFHQIRYIIIIVIINVLICLIVNKKELYFTKIIYLKCLWNNKNNNNNDSNSYAQNVHLEKTDFHLNRLYAHFDFNYAMNI